MSPDELKLAELLCARLCHDLAGPVGAVATGAELLGEEGEMAGGMAAEALALLESSAFAASARLRFLRLALGSAGGRMASSALKDLVVNFLAAQGTGAEALALDWQDGGQGPWEAEPVKLLLNLVLLAKDCLPRGGRLDIMARQDGGTTVTALGPGAAPAESAMALDAGAAGELGPRGAQGAYAAQVAARGGWSITVRSVADSVAFRIG